MSRITESPFAVEAARYFGSGRPAPEAPAGPGCGKKFNGKKFERCCLEKTAEASHEASAPQAAAAGGSRSAREAAMAKRLAFGFGREFDRDHEVPRALFRAGRPAYDFGWIWRELGIERS